MSNLLYLLAAIGLSAIGSTLLYLRHRRPTSVEYGMREFTRGLEALDPSRAEQQRRMPEGEGHPEPRRNRRAGPRG